MDAAVLDIHLKGSVVYPVANALREQGVPFVLAPDYDAYSYRRPVVTFRAGEKPFKPDDLARALPGILQP